MCWKWAKCNAHSKSTLTHNFSLITYLKELFNDAIDIEWLRLLLGRINGGSHSRGGGIGMGWVGVVAGLGLASRVFWTHLDTEVFGILYKQNYKERQCQSSQRMKQNGMDLLSRGEFEGVKGKNPHATRKITFSLSSKKSFFHMTMICWSTKPTTTPPTHPSFLYSKSPHLNPHHLPYHSHYTPPHPNNSILLIPTTITTNRTNNNQQLTIITNYQNPNTPTSPPNISALKSPHNSIPPHPPHPHPSICPFTNNLYPIPLPNSFR